MTKQIQILEIIFLASKQISTKEIGGYMGMTLWQVHSICRHLINRNLIEKKIERFYDDYKMIPGKRALFNIKEKSLYRAIKLIKQLEKEENAK